MANSKSAIKRHRQQVERRQKNRGHRSRLKTSIKRVHSAQDAEAAVLAYREASAMLDRFATRRLIHPNKAARKKSQLARVVASLGGQP